MMLRPNLLLLTLTLGDRTTSAIHAVAGSKDRATPDEFPE